MNRVPAPLIWLAAAAAMLAVPRPAAALPSFAAQTGQPCTACHVGAYGPQLTPFGRAFKIGGYTQGGGEGLAAKIPVSGMVLASFSHTAADQPAPPSAHFATNNNYAIDQISVFFAHRISDYIGAFVQGTYDGVNAATPDPTAPTFFLDNTDIRITAPFDIGDNTLRLGVSINNNPTVQDPYNTTPAWGFPYVASPVSLTPGATPLLDGGLGGTAIGITAYAWWNSALFVEVGGYKAMDTHLARNFGTFPGMGYISGVAPYARIAYEWNWNGQSAHVGAMGMYAAIQPGYVSGIGTDKYTDLGLDASYQWIGDGSNVITVQGLLLHEDQQLDATLAAASADRASHTLDQARMNVSYVYQQTYVLTGGFMRTWGTSDATYYGTRTGKPNSTAFMLEADWVPFGKDGSWGAPHANMKLGVQYTKFTEFDGAVSSYDGTGRNAADNDTIYAFAWFAF
jgi:hypothetical protein